MNVAILLAAGKGERMTGTVPDKALAEVGGNTVFGHSLTAFREAAVAERWIVAYREEEQREHLAREVLRGWVIEHCEDWCITGAPSDLPEVLRDRLGA